MSNREEVEKHREGAGGPADKPFDAVSMGALEPNSKRIALLFGTTLWACVPRRLIEKYRKTTLRAPFTGPHTHQPRDTRQRGTHGCREDAQFGAIDMSLGKRQVGDEQSHREADSREQTATR